MYTGDGFQMNKSEKEFSRVKRKNKRSRSDWFLNSLIAVVALLIVVTLVFIFKDDGDVQKAEENAVEEKQADKNSLAEEDKVVTEEEPKEEKEEQPEKDTAAKVENEDSTDETPETSEEPGTLTHKPSDDKVVIETIVDTSWEPIATSQTGEHVSSYDGKSVDWNEKKEAIAYATGNSADSLIFWKVNNGGSPQKSIGIVSTYDKSEKYRVYIEWVEQEGWKPVQVDVLNTLDL